MWVKREDEKGYRTKALVFSLTAEPAEAGAEGAGRVAAAPAEPAGRQLFPPPGELICSREFYLRGFTLIGRSLEQENPNKQAELRIRKPADFGIVCTVENLDGEAVPGGFTYTIRGDICTFRFPPRDVPAVRQVRLYSMDGRGIKTEICRFYLELP